MWTVTATATDWQRMKSLDRGGTDYSLHLFPSQTNRCSNCIMSNTLSSQSGFLLRLWSRSDPATAACCWLLIVMFTAKSMLETRTSINLNFYSVYMKWRVSACFSTFVIKSWWPSNRKPLDNFFSEEFTLKSPWTYYWQNNGGIFSRWNGCYLNFHRHINDRGYLTVLPRPQRPHVCSQQSITKLFLESRCGQRLH